MPKGISGIAETSFSSAHDIWPLICFTLGLISSSYGMSKFLSLVPIDKRPADKVFSLAFVGVIFLNLFFVMRLYCIENILYSYYQFYPRNLQNGTLNPTFTEPLLPLHYKHLRPLFYFLPSFISIAVNIWQLKRANCLKSIMTKHPQILILSGFSPYIFEKSENDGENNNNKLQVWRFGSIVNSIYIGIVPPIALIISEYARGITSLDLTPIHAIEDKYASSSLNLLLDSSLSNVIFCIAFVVLAVLVILCMFCECPTKVTGDCRSCCNTQAKEDKNIKNEAIELIQQR